MLIQMVHQITLLKMRRIIFGLDIIDSKLQEVMMLPEKLGELFKALEAHLMIGIGIQVL